MSFDANNILEELVSSSQALPTFDVFEVLWATRNVCVPGFGVFDAKLEKRKIGVNPVIYTTLMDAYFKAGNCMEAINLGLVQEAIYYFGRMPDFDLQPNVAVYTALLDGLCKNNCIGAAKKLFDEMQDKNTIPDRIAYTVIIDGNLKHGNFQEALNMRIKMMEMGIELDLHTCTALAWGLSQCGQVQQARKFLAEMFGKGIIPDEFSLFANANTLKEFPAYSVMAAVRRKLVALMPDSRPPNVTLEVTAEKESLLSWKGITAHILCAKMFRHCCIFPWPGGGSSVDSCKASIHS
ncbi:putative pentatricopeptide repeat-containing protein At2g02150 [Populus trichocarpa]|uniref:putative pentatricopeptide repeat-containing protein At2g02150 n=1 Tax=Populus trichocarpa TaxID=3694 RepID=UPI0022773EED|nr:putative pentatricopeptide repeat-containing protein At2g02150 [Populus trichocarpa]